MSSSHMLTLDLAVGETYPLLVNALSAYADVLEHQSDEQDSLGNREYSVALSRTADEARRLVALATSAMEA